MGLSNVLGYLVVMLLSRPLGPAAFGGYTALSTYGVLLSIPAGVFQVVVARRLSGNDSNHTNNSTHGDTGNPATSAIGPALLIGAGCFVLTAAIAPLLSRLFHLPSAAPVLLGAMLVPMMVTGCFQGMLLGRHRLRALSALYLVTALTRVVAAVVCAARGFGVTQVFAAMLVAGSVSALFGAWLCRADLRSLPMTGHELAGEMLRSNSTLAAYIALTNVDVLFARHFLTPHDSGGYALASTFGRAVCWGTQFVALLVVPRMQRHGATRALLRASAVVFGIGVVGFGIVAISPSGWITVAGGADYREFGGLALLCVLLGIAWAVAQVWLFSEMSTNTGALGALTWGVIVAECLALALWWHDSPEQIAIVCLVGALVIALGGLLRVTLQHRTRIELTEESAVAVADRA
nr:oligosaccharide flippase family protein [Flexivirga aerilata]